MADIQYDPSCVDCRRDASKDVAGTTWQCNGHVRAERDWLRARMALVVVEAEHGKEVLTKERNAALTLAEQRGAAYDMTRRDLVRLRAAATYALAVLTRLADSAYLWAGRDVPVGLTAEIDEAKARLAGVLS